MTNHRQSRVLGIAHTLSRTGAAILGALFLLAGPATGTAAAPTCSPLTAGAIGGIVFLNANHDGVRQAGEEGINRVVLRVTGPGGDADRAEHQPVGQRGRDRHLPPVAVLERVGDRLRHPVPGHVELVHVLAVLDQQDRSGLRT